MSEIHLGDEVKDMITGFEGVVVSRLEHLFGGVEYKIQQRNLNGDERPLEPLWIEEARLECKRKSIHFSNDECVITEQELSEARKTQG